MSALIGAEGARAATKNAIEVNIRKFEEAVQKEWEYWEPDIASAIEEATANGEFNAVVRKPDKYENETALREMIKRHVTALGYKTNLHDCGYGMYRIDIK